MPALPIAAIATIVLAGLFLIAALFIDIGRSERSPICMDEKMREHVREVMHEGIERALQEQLTRLFSVRMRDYAGSPQAALTGVNNSIIAYVNIHRAITNWNPPTC